jgi:outer membrane protein W
MKAIIVIVKWILNKMKKIIKIYKIRMINQKIMPRKASNKIKIQNVESTNMMLNNRLKDIKKSKNINLLTINNFITDNLKVRVNSIILIISNKASWINMCLEIC